MRLYTCSGEQYTHRTFSRSRSPELTHPSSPPTSPPPPTPTKRCERARPPPTASSHSSQPNRCTTTTTNSHLTPTASNHAAQPEASPTSPPPAGSPVITTTSPTFSSARTRRTKQRCSAGVSILSTATSVSSCHSRHQQQLKQQLVARLTYSSIILKRLRKSATTAGGGCTVFAARCGVCRRDSGRKHQQQHCPHDQQHLQPQPNLPRHTMCCQQSATVSSGGYNDNTTRPPAQRRRWCHG